MRPTIHHPIPPRTRVRVEQRILHGRDEWHTTAEGEVVSHDLEPTGAWHAQGYRDKFWLPRLRIRKPDGELSALNLDANSRVVILQPAK